MYTVPNRSFTHQRSSPTWLLSSLALVLALVAGCMPIQPAAAPKPITLRLALPDGPGLPRIDNYVQEFITQTLTLSQGAITIEPVYHAGDGTFAGYEKGVLQRMLTGKFDLALVPSRTWDSESITNFQALQAPFLVNNDALAEAVATSAIGTQMLDSLSAVGLVGLTLWPEDLRHPFSVVPDKPFLSPKDAAGKQMRAAPSDVTYQLIDALGATPMFEDSGYEVAESGLQQGGTLTGKPSATGNVIFYPKYQILFATSAAFAQLTDQQRLILRQAAAATQKKAIANRPKEVDAAAAYCADGGTIVLASDEQVKAFEQAAKPVFDNLAQDPLNAKLIAAIRELKASTKPSAGAAACAPVATAPSPASATSPVSQTWSAGLPPNGVWQVELTAEDFVKMGTLNAVAATSAGVYSWTFQDDRAEFKIHGPTLNVFCVAVATVVENSVRLRYDGSHGCDAAAYDEVQWRLDPDGLHFQVVGCSHCQTTELKAMYETKPWQQKVEAWSPGLPPNGVWRVTLTVDELVQRGMLRSTAADYAGVSTITFQDGKQRGQWVGEQGQKGDCTATYKVVEDFVRITRTPITANCPPEVDDIQWRLDKDGLHLHLVAIQGAPLLESQIGLEAKPWQQVEAWSPGLPPNGVWQARLTIDDLLGMGDLRSVAHDWAGVHTLTFQDGKFQKYFQGDQVPPGKCQANYAVVDDFVRLTYFSDSDECPGEVDDIQWRLDADGLHLHVVAIHNAQLVENKAMFEAKAWQKVK